MRTPLDAAAYYACVENGRRFGGLEGDAGVGTHGGSEDHAAIVVGRPGMVSAFGFVPLVSSYVGVSLESGHELQKRCVWAA